MRFWSLFTCYSFRVGRAYDVTDDLLHKFIRYQPRPQVCVPLQSVSLSGSIRFVHCFIIIVTFVVNSVVVINIVITIIIIIKSGGVAQWVASLTRNEEVVGSSPSNGPRCFVEQETLPLLLSTGWFQERIRA